MSPADPNHRPVPGSGGVLSWLCLAAIIAYIARNSIAVAESTIREKLGISETDMGLVMSAFFLTYAGLSIPAGWLAHVWGSRRALPIFAACWSAATAALSLATGFRTLLAARLVMGASQSGLFPGSVSTLSRWFPATRRALASAALGSCMSVGGAIGAYLTGRLIAPLGWRATFAVYATFGLLWAAGFRVWFRDFPARRGDDDIEPAGQEAAPPTPWGTLLRSPAVWWISGQQLFRAAGYIFFASWFATYLQEARDVSVPASGTLTAYPLLGVVPGSLLGGVLSDRVLARTGSRRLARQGVAVASLLTCSLMVLLAYTVESGTVAVLLISVGSFFAAIAGPCAYAITMDLGGWHVAVLFSTMNMAGNIGALAFPIIVPWFRQWTGSWDSVLLLFGALYVGAALCWLMLNPTSTIFDHAEDSPEAAADGPR